MTPCHRYHMTRNSMRCPVCRHGLDDAMNYESIPLHFRAEMIAKITRERRVQEEEDFEDVERMQVSLDRTAKQ